MAEARRHLMSARGRPSTEKEGVMKKKDASEINACLRKCFSESAACVRDNNGIFVCKTYSECREKCSGS